MAKYLNKQHVNSWPKGVIFSYCFFSLALVVRLIIMQQKELYATYASLFEEKEKLKYLYKNIEENANIAPIPKTYKTFMKHQEQGKAHLKSKDFKAALKCYTISLMHAASSGRVSGIALGNETGDDSSESDEESLVSGSPLSIGYSNRSAVLFRMEHYEAAIKDIDRALQYGFEPSKQYPLIRRKIKCYIELKKYSSAKEIIENWQEKPNTSTKIRRELKEVNNSIHDAEDDPAKFSPVMHRKCKYPNLTHSPHLKYPPMSAALELRNNEERGRHLVALKDISPGKE